MLSRRHGMVRFRDFRQSFAMAARSASDLGCRCTTLSRTLADVCQPSLGWASAIYTRRNCALSWKRCHSASTVPAWDRKGGQV
jgi:hypothetical protein